MMCVTGRPNNFEKRKLFLLTVAVSLSQVFAEEEPPVVEILEAGSVRATLSRSSQTVTVAHPLVLVLEVSQETKSIEETLQSGRDTAFIVEPIFTNWKSIAGFPFMSQEEEQYLQGGRRYSQWTLRFQAQRPASFLVPSLSVALWPSRPQESPKTLTFGPLPIEVASLLPADPNEQMLQPLLESLPATPLSPGTRPLLILSTLLPICGWLGLYLWEKKRRSSKIDPRLTREDMLQSLAEATSVETAYHSFARWIRERHLQREREALALLGDLETLHFSSAKPPPLSPDLRERLAQFIRLGQTSSRSSCQ
ncbi:MAG: hypothetical protein AAF191_00075 [Verrucomicrobiota bacterium]